MSNKRFIIQRFLPQNADLPVYLCHEEYGTCYAGLEKYKYRVIFVLVSRVICTPRSGVG